jgi:hypothetical protein
MDEPAELHDQLLATKFFIPSSSHALIFRPRLLKLLMKSLECPLTLVTGLVDAFSYLVLGHVFVANMTGNVVFLAFALAA